jgi:hypothetical protein
MPWFIVLFLDLRDSSAYHLCHQQKKLLGHRRTSFRLAS